MQFRPIIQASSIMKYKIAAVIIVLSGFIAFYFYYTNQSTVKTTEIAPATVQQKQKIYLNLPYSQPSDVALTNKQTLNLHLPDKAAANAPLFIFIPGGFWAEPGQNFLLNQPSINLLTERGIAVAQLRHRVAPKYQHPAQINDVSAALSFLLNNASKYGYNAKNIYLVGHSSGGHLATLLVQDPQYLAKHNIKPQQLAGIIIISGIFDVTQAAVVSPQQDELYKNAFGQDATVRKLASPFYHPQATLPPMLFVSAEQDLPGFSSNARKYMYQLRGAGNKKTYHHVMPRNTHLSLVMLDNAQNPLLRYILSFMNIDSGSDFFHKRVIARRYWHEPPVSTEGFWKDGSLVKSHTIDERFASSLVRLFQGNSYMLGAWPLEKFHAIDLFTYLDSLDTKKYGKGKYLITNNLRDERLYLDLEKLRPYQPVIVVGLDDEKNLFRMAVFYETLRQYSWLSDTKPQPLSVRPLGAHLYFMKPPPDDLIPRHLSNYSLTPDSFQLVEEDPLNWLSKLPAVLHSAFTYENGCVSCHAFKGMTAQSHHTDALTLEPHGGFARPLTSYPPEVWREFVFHQEKVAAKIGVVANSMRVEVRQPLFELIEKAR